VSALAALFVVHLLVVASPGPAFLAVSRTAYREAVRILAAKGLVDARPKVGTRINPRNMWHLLDPDVLDWMFESEPDLVLLDSLFELRDVVESEAAGFAARRRTAAHLQGMRSAIEGMATHTLATEQGRQADLDFHTMLLQATGNGTYALLFPKAGEHKVRLELADSLHRPIPGASKLVEFVVPGPKPQN